MSTSIQNKIPVIFLFGPTAVGKTDLLLELFEGRAEVISADSVQIYRGLDIGSAKPEPRYLRKLPHHLINIRRMEENFNTGDFVRLADEAVADIYNRNKIPVISGGTAFYFKNFYYGLPPLKGDTSGAREILQQQIDQNGLALLWEELRKVDPTYAGKISCNDKQRIQRALEVYHSTGRPLSSFPPPDIPRKNYRFLLIGLDRDRKELYARIDKRVEWMFEQGLEKELEELVAQGAVADYQSMKAIGYREFFDPVSGAFRKEHSIMAEIQKDTRHYAKRQLTFFRSLKNVCWFHPDDKDAIEERIESFLKISDPPLT